MSRFLCLLLILVLTPAALPAQAQTIRVLVNDAPPYRIIGSANGAPTYSGFYVDVLRAITADRGMTLDFTDLPFARAFRVMEEGGADVMLGPNRSAEREAYLQYLEPPLPREPKVFLQQAGMPPIRVYEDLQGRRIALLRGATYFDRFDADDALIKIALDDYASAMRLTVIGRADAVVMPDLQARWLLHQTGLLLQIAEYREAGRDSYIVLARRSPLVARAAELEGALRQLVGSGAMRRIQQRYQ